MCYSAHGDGSGGGEREVALRKVNPDATGDAGPP